MKCNDTGFIMVTREDGSEGAAPCSCRDDVPSKKPLCFFFETDLSQEFKNKTFGDYLMGFDSKQDHAKERCELYVKNFKKVIPTGKGIYLVSEIPGSGKTMLACITIAELAREYNLKTQVISTIELLHRIKGTFKTDISELAIINPLKAADILLIDDLGSEKKTEWSEETLLDIIETRRSRNRITFFTSNYHIPDLPYEKRLISRINTMTAKIRMPDLDIRAKVSREKDEWLFNELKK